MADARPAADFSPIGQTGGNPGAGGSLGTGGGGFFASGGTSPDPGTGSGGLGGTGGTIGTAGTGGLVGSGGAGTGGSGTGGSIGTGGARATGGTIGTGGFVGTGGTTTGGVMGTGGRGTGGAVGTGGRGTGGAVGTGGVGTVRGKYDFEASVQSWTASAGSPAFTSITRSTTQRYAGQSALAAAITATAAGVYQLGVSPTPSIPAGATITFHIFVPTSAATAVAWVQPYAFFQGPPTVWNGMATPTSSLTLGAWNTLTVVVPTTSAGISLIGVQFNVTAAWTGTFYIDDVTW